MFNALRNHSQSGLTLIEVLIGISIIGGILVTIGLSVNAFVTARSELLVETQALYLTEEGVEITRALRNDDWNTVDAFTLDTPYYFAVATTTLAIGSTPEVIDNTFFRQVIFRSVYRNASDDIVASTTGGASVDGELREVEVSVGGPTGTTTLRTILSNLGAI